MYTICTLVHIWVSIPSTFSFSVQKGCINRIPFHPGPMVPGWVYCHIYNAMQYHNTALETTALVMHDSNAFFYGVPPFLMALQISYIVMISIINRTSYM